MVKVGQSVSLSASWKIQTALHRLGPWKVQGSAAAPYVSDKMQCHEHQHQKVVATSQSQISDSHLLFRGAWSEEYRQAIIQDLMTKGTIELKTWGISDLNYEW